MGTTFWGRCHREKQKNGGGDCGAEALRIDRWSDLTYLSHCNTQNVSSGQSLSPAKAAILLSLTLWRWNFLLNFSTPCI
jgi:hypothetical protein